MRTLIAWLSVSLVVTGCASIEASPNAGPHRRVGQVPSIGQPTSAPVGSVIFTQYDYTTYDRAVVDQPYTRRILLSKIAVNGGQILFPADVGGQSGWCSSNPTFFEIGDYRSMCFFDPGNTGSFQKGYVAGTLKGEDFDVSIPYRVKNLSGGKGFKYELLYEGFDHGAIKVSYREYLDDFIRPSFQQDLSYTLQNGTTPISFRTVRISVSGADDNEINYTVLSNFQIPSDGDQD